MESKEKQEAAAECIKIMADFFYQRIDGIGVVEMPDDKGFYYLSKKRADEFKKAYNKYIFR